MSVFDYLQGKKTYIAAAGLALLALYQYVNTGTLDLATLKTFAESLGLYGLRSAIDAQAAQQQQPPKAQ